MKKQVPKPTPAQIRKYIKRWESLEDYVLQEASLNRLFQVLCPQNTSIEDVLLKVCALNDFYSTNIFKTYPVAKRILKLNIDWNAAMWGSGPAIPASGNDYVSATGGDDLFRISASGASSTFQGDSLELVSGVRALMKTKDENTSAIAGDFILNGGWLSLAPDSSANDATLAASSFVVTADGTIGLAASSSSLTIDAVLTGSADVELYYEPGADAGSRQVIFANVGAYTGDIDATEGVDIDFNADHTFAGGLTLSAGSVLTVDQDLTFFHGKLIDDANGAVAPGTYSGTALTALGANYSNGGGTLTVVQYPLPTATVTQTVDDIDWNGDMWGSPAAGPVSGDLHVSASVGAQNRFLTSTEDSTFGGDSLKVVTGTKAVLKTEHGHTSTIPGYLILDGGSLIHQPGSGTHHVTLDALILSVTVNGGFIAVGSDSWRLSIDAVLTGIGDLTLRYNSGTDANERRVSFGLVGDYTGDISVTENVTIDFGTDHDFAGKLTLTGDSTLNVDQTLTFAYGNLVDPINGSVASGSYSGTTLSDLGANYSDSGGTLIVEAPVGMVMSIR